MLTDFGVKSLLKNISCKLKRDEKITILGGGPGGISVAFYAKKSNLPFELFEASTKLGGNCSTFNYKNFYYDSGAHRLHDKDKETTDDIRALIGEELKLINVPSQIYRDGKYIDFPLTPLNIFSFLGPLKFFTAAKQIILNKIIKRKNKNFKDLAIGTYGKLIAELFLLKYTEKLWGKTPEKLSKKVAGSRLKGLDFKTFLLESLKKNKKKVTHLDGEFYYPKSGIGSIFEKMGDYCGSNSIHLNHQITKLIHNNKNIKYLEYNNSNLTQVSSVVSSLPLGLLIKLLNPAPPKKILNTINSIQFRNLILVAFFIDKNSINSNGSMYFPSNEFVFTRVYEPRNRSSFMSPEGKTSLIAEIPCQRDDEIWQLDENTVLEKIKCDLIKCGFFNEKELINGEIRKLFNAYPILENNFEKKIAPIFDYLSKFKNLTITGRNGLFEYSHIHDHMRNARKIISNQS
tara:strand:+ start:675 stop:2051 length:1377 start_codon:yes stop_codon:yes gene_type:complete